MVYVIVESSVCACGKASCLSNPANRVYVCWSKKEAEEKFSELRNEMNEKDNSHHRDSLQCFVMENDESRECDFDES